MIVVDGATHFKRMVWRGNGGSLKDGAEAFKLFLHGAQLVLRSSVLTVFDLDEVNVTLENVEIFGLVLSGESYLLVAAGGAIEVLPVSLSCPLPLLRTRPPSSLVCCFFVFVVMGATSTTSGRLSFLLLVLCWTSLTGLFLSAGKKKHGTRYQSGLLFLNFMWGVVFTACVVFLLLFLSSGRLEVNLFLSEKRGGKSHFSSVNCPGRSAEFGPASHACRLSQAPPDSGMCKRVCMCSNAAYMCGSGWVRRVLNGSLFVWKVFTLNWVK